MKLGKRECRSEVKEKRSEGGRERRDDSWAIERGYDWGERERGV